MRPTYVVNITKLKDYIFVVSEEKTYYETTLTEREIEKLKDINLYSLDWKIWTSLEQLG